MSQNISKDLVLTDASIEIIIMLVWMFVLWFILGSFLKSKSWKSDITSDVLLDIDTGKKEKSRKMPKQDDFQLIEWIGPAIEKLLHKNGVTRFKDIVKQDVEWLEMILLEGWKKYSAHNPSTWPDQAELAAGKKWRELEEYQEILNAWKKRKQKKQS